MVATPRGAERAATDGGAGLQIRPVLGKVLRRRGECRGLAVRRGRARRFSPGTAHHRRRQLGGRPGPGHHGRPAGPARRGGTLGRRSRPGRAAQHDPARRGGLPRHRHRAAGQPDARGAAGGAAAVPHGEPDPVRRTVRRAARDAARRDRRQRPRRCRVRRRLEPPGPPMNRPPMNRNPLAYLEVLFATMAAATTAVLYSGFFTTREYLLPLLVAAGGAALLAVLCAVRRSRVPPPPPVGLLGFPVRAAALGSRGSP